MLLSLISLSLLLATGSANAKQCEHVLPGVERLARGIDITTLDLFPADLAQTNGFRQALFTFTCDQGTKWTHPVTNTEHSVPDQISSVNSLPGGAMNDKVTIHSNVEGFRLSLGGNLGVDANTVKYGDYSLSGALKYVQERVLSSNQTVADVSAYVAAVQMDFKPYFAMKPNENFQLYLTEYLPAKYEDGPEKYQEFLDTFGTHYFETGLFGGYLLEQSVIENDYLYQANDVELSGNLKAGYAQLVSGNLGGNVAVAKNNSVFNQHSKSSAFYYGGAPNLGAKMSPEQFTQWSVSVAKDPWLFGGRLRPVEKLIKNATIQAQMQTAVFVKRTKAFLVEAKRTLDLIKPKLANSFDSEVKAINEMSARLEKAPKESELADLAAKVDKLVHEVQGVANRRYLEQYSGELEKVQKYEIHCKQLVVNLCDHEKKREYDDAVKEIKTLQQKMYSLGHEPTPPTNEQVRTLTNKATQLIQYQQMTPIGECRDPILCNICKSAIVDIITRNPCDSTHIKKLLNVHI